MQTETALLKSSHVKVTESAEAMVRFWDCTIAGCSSAAAIDVGSCERCQSMYCAAHVRSAVHMCEKTNHAALLLRAKELSGGLECRLDDRDPLGRSQMGGMHVHLQLLFEDGTAWLVRILRETHTSFNDELSNQILLSECATLQWLESLDLPTPRLHGYGLRGDPKNEVGVAYMIIDRLPGRPFNSATASQEQRSKVLCQWAGVLCKLGEHPFDMIGSLQFDGNGVINVGPIASDRSGTLPCIGPFRNARDYYSSWATAYLELIADGQLFSAYSVDAYLMFKFLEEQVKTGPWLEKWQRLNFVPAYEAFGPSLTSANTSNLFNGILGWSEEDRLLGQELQHLRTSHCYFESDEMRRFLFEPGVGLGLNKDEALNVFQGLVTTFHDAIPNWEEWRRTCLTKWMGDPQLATILRTLPTSMALPSTV
ncbi:hypothetical protein F5Y12DRAFT_784534 [Xylaria sp. FL1777]|nr:hypothetical protein F5Y12DRAFT_784534 [Xylaria sp. FL1777]